MSLQPVKEYYPNMDILRYLLALAVVIAHNNGLAGYDIYFPINSFEAVGGFFALSGFLMYHSYTKHHDTLKYTLSRARRILPPYVFIILLCYAGLSAVSTLPATEYFSNPQGYKYLLANLSFLNWLEPTLPGVFTGDKFSEASVNGSLWTMKVEWCLYASVPCFVLLLKKFRFSPRILSCTIIILSILYRLLLSYLFQTTGQSIFNILGRQIFGQLSYFYCGMLIYFCRDYLRERYIILALFGLLCYILTETIDLWWLRICLNPLAISSFIMAFCFVPYDLDFLKRIPNLSYEMYLFHVPVIQLIVQFNLNTLPTVTEITIVLIATTILAAVCDLIVKNLVLKKR